MRVTGSDLAIQKTIKAEPLMRRVVLIFAQFTDSIGNRHPQLQAVCENYYELLEATGLTEAEATERLLAALREGGLDVPG